MTKTELTEILKSFASESLFDATGKLLAHLGVRCTTLTEEPLSLLDLYADAAHEVGAKVPESIRDVLARVGTAHFIGTVDDTTLVGETSVEEGGAAALKAAAAKEKYNGLYAFAVQMKPDAPLSRADAATVVRAINRLAQQKPATVLILEGTTPEKTTLSIATCERSAYKQTWRPGERLGKVSILKGIDCHHPHRGHLDILESMNVKKAKSFDALYEQWKKVFSTSLLTNKFYNELFGWYVWAVDSATDVYFPNDPDDDKDDYEGRDTKVIRLITRVMFVWFIRQKKLVPDWIFDEDHLKRILKDFNPLATDSGTYYNAVLQNLFFATLNRAIEDEDGKRRFAELSGHVDAKNLYRYDELYTISKDEIVEHFASIPFVNGSLFECLDKTQGNDGVGKAFYYDGFSRNDRRVPGTNHYRYRAFVPNNLFFDPERGLFSIFSRYNFTIEENTPLEQQVALDPELLGKVFENLLGVYNPETKETARKKSGSFYTPREIVDYMVDQSLISYLGDTTLVRNLFSESFVYKELDWAEYQNIAAKLKTVKVLDPACGSGAFPVGMLNRIVEILGKLKTDRGNVFKLKRHIIENCLYGSDIQCIAAQITKLRFFISLIVNCEKDLSKPNFGIPELPNLETKFVAANSLIGVAKIEKGQDLFENPKVVDITEELRKVRHDHFNANTAARKRRLVKRDAELRQKLFKELDGNFFQQKDADKLACWNPYDQNVSAPFFDPEWMFGIKDGFDIVIGNPPYVVVSGDDPLKDYYDVHYVTAKGGKKNLFRLFFERSVLLLKEKGCLSFITPNTFLSGKAGAALRGFFFDNVTFRQLLEYSESDKVFENVTQAVVVSVMTRELAPTNHMVKMRTERQGDLWASQAKMSETGSLIPQNSIVEKFFAQSKTIGDYVNGFQGEVNVSTQKDSYSPAKLPDTLPMWRGEHVGRYVACSSPCEYCKITAPKRDHYKWPRIITQEVSNQSCSFRTKCCIIPANQICGHSTNYITKCSTDEADLYFWLGLVNSTLFNYVFNYANPTNHIPIGKLVRMPVPDLVGSNTRPIITRVNAILAAKKTHPNADTAALEAEIDDLVFDLYGLTAEEREIVKGGGK